MKSHGFSVLQRCSWRECGVLTGVTSRGKQARENTVRVSTVIDVK